MIRHFHRKRIKIVEGGKILGQGVTQKKFFKGKNSYFLEQKRLKTPISNKSKGGSYVETYENVKKTKIDLRNFTPNLENFEGKRAPKMSKTSTKSTNELNNTPNNFSQKSNFRRRREIGRSNTPVKKSNNGIRGYRSNSKNKISHKNYNEIFSKKSQKSKNSEKMKNRKKSKNMKKSENFEKDEKNFE